MALLDVKPGSGPDLEAALADARAIFATVRGCRSVELRRCVEVPDRYALLIEWERIEDHLEGFVGSPANAEVGALLGPFIERHEMAHYETVPSV